MKLIVGLGNPGKKYERTRHNVGFLVADALLEYDQNEWTRGKGPFQINRKPFQNGKALIAKPTLFMNESGIAVQKLLEQFQISLSDCLVIVDDVNLPVGKIRFRSKGSAGGHHGLESIIREMGGDHFPRLRIGVGSGDLTGKDLTDYVLGDFSKEERPLILSQIERSRDACLDWLESGETAVAQKYNQ
ncbi:MAG: aminoacyl-tRNA hydrolase [Candidatus Omnitrophica bacterium]|nr:aminoacyl-tRNA hydrolase [Candidatus Omnitrophota bacterium]